MATKTPPSAKSLKRSATAITDAPLPADSGAPETEASLPREAVFDIFRRWGFLQASLDPLNQYLAPEPFPTPAPDGADSEEARKFYCGTIGVEFMHIPSPEKRAWIAEQMERDYTPEDTGRILTGLIKGDIFEQVAQQRYLGTKRFSLEGLTAVIPFMDQLLTSAARTGVTRSVFAMAHRGRLNVMVNIVGRDGYEMFSKFQDVDPRSTMGGGDVKYHMGATGDYTTPDGKVVRLHLASNPSHLEAVDPVVMGRAKAHQARIGENGQREVLPMIFHGDAAFAGQGIWAETMVLATLPGYNVGGTIQIITNNLLGFTANPEESNSSRFASDLAKRMPVPIFHVNAEDPAAVVRVAEIAANYRATFGNDVVVDLIGYRRHGHSEVDDPTVTQPRRYAKVKDHPQLYKLYAKDLGVDPAAEIAEIQAKFMADQKKAAERQDKDDNTFVMKRMHELPTYWDNYTGGPLDPADTPRTGLDAERIADLTGKLTRWPDGFHIHPKVAKLFEQRGEMGVGKRAIDYGFAELLAFSSLLEAGMPVRLSGQDSQRGTFNHRHSVLIDTETEQRWSPLSNLTPEQARFEVYNSMLSEAGCLGYEYGYARDFPEALVLWEAQFGDFANGAQIIIDQFLVAGEAKWGLLSGIVLLLPHGYEGQGAEHSSARLERFLQLCAQDNIQVVQPSTAAQHFHMLRRQALRKWRKPLVVMTPKSMLRHPDAMSTVADLGAGEFQTVIPDTTVQNPRRILVCSGKIGHNLRVERAKRKLTDVAIVFVDQLYPWPEAELQAALDMHPSAHEIVWVQEEPANMGALSFVMPRLKRLTGYRSLTSVKRSASATPATGSARAHDLEEKTLIDLALGR